MISMCMHSVFSFRLRLHLPQSNNGAPLLRLQNRSYCRNCVPYTCLFGSRKLEAGAGQQGFLPSWIAKMAFATRLSLLCVLLATSVLAAPAGRRTVSNALFAEVMQLTDDNFDSQTATGKWFLSVTAPWCSHCKELEPIWAALAIELKQHGITVAKVDGTKQRALMKVRDGGVRVRRATLHTGRSCRALAFVFSTSRTL